VDMVEPAVDLRLYDTLLTEEVAHVG